MRQMKKADLSREEWASLIAWTVLIVLAVLILRFLIADQVFVYLMHY
jgi:preprotein translocase subunit SecE